MAYIKKAYGQAINIPSNTYQADTLRDMYEIDVTNDIIGTKCYVINNNGSGVGAWYYLGSDKQWYISGSGGGFDPSGDVIYEGGDLDA